MAGVDREEVLKGGDHVPFGVDEGAGYLQIDGGSEAVLGSDVQKEGEVGLGLVVGRLRAVPGLDERVDAGLLGPENVPFDGRGVGRGVGVEGLIGQRFLPGGHIVPGVVEGQDEPLPLGIGGGRSEQADEEE